jgi:hypothetical protein
MRHAQTLRRPSTALIATLVLALGVLGVALAGVERSALATEVKVVFTADRKLTVRPAGVQAGPVTFVLVNKGRQLGVFAVKGPGVDGVRTLKVKPGHIATLNVKLKSGQYLLWDQARNGNSSVRRFMVQSPTAGTGPYKPAPQRPPTTEIAPTGVGCDV